MSVFLFFTGSSFYIKDEQGSVAAIALGIYLFGIVYSPGEGPVPFTYSAEAYPLYVRGLGMSLATATTWYVLSLRLQCSIQTADLCHRLFNAVLSVTYPLLSLAFTPAGSFYFYAAWNIVGFVLVLLFMPETKGKTLEELDQVFGVPTHVHAKWGMRQVPYFFKRYLLRQHVEPEELYQPEEVEEEKGYEHAASAEDGSRDSEE